MTLLAAFAGAGCRQDMHDQPRCEPLEASTFFTDGRSSRLPVEGTVYRGGLHEDEILYTGKSGDEFAGEIPLPVTRELLQRGRQRYDIYCLCACTNTDHADTQPRDKTLGTCKMLRIESFAEDPM